MNTDSTVLQALFSLMHSRGYSSADHQFVLDFPRREYRLTSENRFMTLAENGFGAQEVVRMEKIEREMR